MKLRALLILFILSTATLCYGQTKSSDLYDIKIKKIKDDVYVAYRPEPLRYFVEGNVTIIVNEQDVVVVDAGGAPLAARNIIAEIKRLTPKPVRFLINTHDHVDHTLGNQEFVRAFPGIEIISHARTRENLDKDGRNYVAETIKNYETREARAEALFKRLKEEGRPPDDKVIAYWERYSNEDIHIRTEEYRKTVITLPTTTFENRLTLHRGRRTIELLFLGHGDTPGDVVVYLPQDRIVCTGDMLTEPIPYGFSVQPLEWFVTLGKLSKLDFDYLIPGHGEIQSGKNYLNRVMNLLQSVQEQVKAAITEGLDLESTRKRINLSKFVYEFTRNDPLLEYRFRGWFINPNIGETFRVMKEKSEQK